jgi:uncharacterized protein YlxP (DUF503 family)
MVIGVCTIELYLPENHSLKGKRHVVNGLKEKLKSRFNISVAEIDHLDVWQRATIGAVMINTNQVYIDRELQKMINFLESSQYAPYLFDYTIEFL